MFIYFHLAVDLAAALIIIGTQPLRQSRRPLSKGAEQGVKHFVCRRHDLRGCLIRLLKLQ